MSSGGRPASPAKKTHALWRRSGLKYLVMGDGTFLYDPAEVTKFLKRFYAPQQLKQTLIP